MEEGRFDLEQFMRQNPEGFLRYCGQTTPKLKGKRVLTARYLERFYGILARETPSQPPPRAQRQSCIEKLKQLTAMVLSESATIITANSRRGTYVQPYRDDGPSHELLHIEPCKMTLKRHGLLVVTSCEFHPFSGGGGEYRVHAKSAVFPDEIVVYGTTNMALLGSELEREMERSLSQIGEFARLLRP